MNKILDVFEKYSLATMLSIYGVIVIGISTSPILYSKLILLATIVTAGVLFWIIKHSINGKLSFASGKYDLAVIGLAAAYVISALLITPNKQEAFFMPGVAGFVLLSACIYFLVNQFDKNGKSIISGALFISGVLLSIIVIFTELGFFSKIPQLSALVKDANFNPLGGSVPSIIYLITMLVLGISHILKEHDIAKKSFWGICAGIVLLGLIVVGINSLPGKPQSPSFPTTRNSWEITVDTLKNNPLWGAGPANYLTAFNLYRPVSYNQTDLWPVRFTTASNFIFTLITETGFAGLIAFAFILLTFYKNFTFDRRNGENLIEKISFAVLVVLLAILPGSPLLFLPLLLILALISKSENKMYIMDFHSPVPAIVVGIILLSGVLAMDGMAIKFTRAEVSFKRALESLSKNDAKSTYDHMQKAIALNPRVDRYHASLAQVNMAIASSLASNKDITDADKETVTQLVQGAIAEGKSTVSLNPQRSGNWEVLGQIYRSIMPFAQGADQFAIQTFTQAVALDPTNPNLRISLGGIYYALGQYDNAIESYKLATLAKPNLPNAHYNLAVAYREKKDYDKAINEMNAVLSLVAKNSEDYDIAQKTLDEIKKSKPTEVSESENLSAPKPLEETNINPPIQLPEEANPPSPEVAE